MTDMYEPKIVLDRKSLKALASESRLRVLKELDAHPLTVSELSRVTSLSKPTLLKHLEQLMAAELVLKKEDHRKWVYYKITGKGKNILHPERVKIMLLLATALFSLFGGIATIVVWLETAARQAVTTLGGNLTRGGETLHRGAENLPPGEPVRAAEAAFGIDPLLLIGIALFITFTITILAAWWLRKKAKNAAKL